ncbi:MAG: RnfABCDGE type electron transport complex subunit D [Spirochaetaceae bacterium]|nr:RnfABCDGE type electron transport complex subunit D [Spirochaetaceae bacterium]
MRAPFQRPQVNLSRSTVERMCLVSFCAGLAVLQSSLTDSFVSLQLALAAVLAAVAVEWICNRKCRVRTLWDGSAVASALIFALLLPNTLGPFQAFIGALFAMIVVKHSFGGLGSNWLNTALGGWLFVRFSWPDAFERALEGSPLALFYGSLGRGLTGPPVSPLEILRANSVPSAVLSGVAGFTAFLNDTIFAFTNSELPVGYIDLLLFREPGIIADRGLLALLLGTILIIAFRVSRMRVPLAFLVCYSLAVRFFGALPLGGSLGQGDILFALFSGGIIPAAFLLASDPATGPKSGIASGIFACLTGIFAFVFRYPGGEPYGAFFAVVLFNALTPAVREFERQKLYRYWPVETRRNP